MNCIICEGKMASFFYSPFGVIPNYYSVRPSKNCHFEFNLFQCISCNTVTSSHFINENEMFKNYSYTTTHSPQLNQPIEFLQKQIKAQNIEQIAEIGGNDGHFLDLLISGSEIIDRQCLLIDRVPLYKRSNLSHIKNFLTTELVDKEGLDEKFDLVIARHCLAHNRDLTDFAKAISRIVKKGKYIYIENADLTKTLVNKDFSQFYPEHFFAFSKLSIQTLFKRFGVTVIDYIELDIHNGSFGLLLKNESSSEELNFLDAAYELNDHMEKWVSQGRKTFLNSPHKISLWGLSAKAIFSFNLFCNGEVQIFEKLFDSNIKKIGRFPPGFDKDVTNEKSLDFLDTNKIIFGAPNFSSEFLKKVPENSRYTKFLDYNCHHHRI